VRGHTHGEGGGTGTQAHLDIREHGATEIAKVGAVGAEVRSEIVAGVGGGKGLHTKDSEGREKPEDEDLPNRARRPG
jgi:hypothetical protein